MSWIPRAFGLLPGPLSVRIAEATVILTLVLLGLHFFYSWLGNLMLDQGGTIG
jgi:hypothetical protein